MLKYKKAEISSLSEVFQAWMGGYPEDDAEIRNFLQKTELNTILSVNDFDGLIKGEAYFPEELIKIAYSIVPLKLPVKGKEVTVFPEEFNRFNTRIMQDHGIVRSLNIGFGAALKVKEKFYAAKELEVKRERSKITSKTYSKKHAEKISENAKARRQKEKQENIEELKEKDKINNSRESRKEVLKKYYENHKAEITEKARENPNTKVIKKRYKAKMRFKKTTGKQVISLLNGIINSKSR